MKRIRSRALRLLRAHPRLFGSIVVGVLAAVFLPHAWVGRGVTRLIVGWNVGVWLYLLLAGWMMARASQAQIHRRAQLQAEGAKTILALVGVSSIVSLWAIVGELSVAKDFSGSERLAHVGLAVLTILASWLFTQVMFTLHYAHDYHAAVARGQPGGLQFPDTEAPDYLDFFYFSAVIGTSGQTADVSFASGPMRRVGTLHCMLAFVFNTSLIGLMINVASSLL
ncbi:DUF1345 domain-containing protein [Ideonella dechloratans]|uniref:DUF1345 domain-containing protein n=1 Tax=Ideonella dechloratans TaxID=36863 RepID=UPI0035B2E875